MQRYAEKPLSRTYTALSRCKSAKLYITLSKFTQPYTNKRGLMVSGVGVPPQPFATPYPLTCVLASVRVALSIPWVGMVCPVTYTPWGYGQPDRYQSLHTYASTYIVQLICSSFVIRTNGDRTNPTAPPAIRPPTHPRPTHQSPTVGGNPGPTSAARGRDRGGRRPET